MFIMSIVWLERMMAEKASREYIGGDCVRFIYASYKPLLYIDLYM